MPQEQFYFNLPVTFAGRFLLSLMVCSYKTSLKANKNAAVKTLCDTLGAMPELKSVGCVF